MARTAHDVRTELQALEATARRYDTGMNEGGEGYNPHTAALRTLQAEYDRLMEAEADAACAARRAKEDAEWTKEVTIQRRAAWNAWVRSQGTTVHSAAMAQHCQEVGYDMLLLKRQIVRHRL